MNTYNVIYSTKTYPYKYEYICIVAENMSAVRRLFNNLHLKDKGKIVSISQTNYSQTLNKTYKVFIDHSNSSIIKSVKNNLNVDFSV